MVVSERAMRFLPAALVLFAAPASLALDAAACAVCYKSFNELASNHNNTKAELERSKEYNDKKAQKVDKVQKAQTKRWLKNEYGVALRAGLEEELELLCTRDFMTVSSELQAACTKFIEEHEDDLPRAVLDEKQVDPFCTAAVPGCEGPALESALAKYKKRATKSEAVPKAKHALVRGCVTRLVGKTYTKATRDGSQIAHTIVLLHNSKSKSKGEANDVRYASLFAEFYAFAAATNSSAEGSGSDRFRFAQIDVSRNDVPNGTPLADPSGAVMLVYLLGEASSAPKSLPAVGEASLAFSEPTAVRAQLTQLLLTYLPSKDQGIVRKVMQAREKNQKAEAATAVKEGGASSEGGDGAGASASGSGGGGGAESEEFGPLAAAKAAAAAAKSAPAPPPRRRASSVSKEAETARLSQRCDACVLLAEELAVALNETKAELERSKEFNDKKAQKVDKVQKAQTKRWLKNEYRVELAASVEERLETACDDAALVHPLCDDGMREGAWGGLGATKSKEKDACEKVGSARCKEVIEDHAEALMRGTLDGKGVAACATVLPGCEPRPQLVGRRHAPGGGDAAAAASEKDEV